MHDVAGRGLEDGVDHAVGEHDLGDGVEVAPEEPQVGGVLLGNEGGEAPCAYLVGPVDSRGQRKGGNLIPFDKHHLDDREIVSRRITARDDHAPARSAQVGVGHHHHIVDGVCHDVAVGQHMIRIDEKAGSLLRAAGDGCENEYRTLFEALRDGERGQIHGLCRDRGVGGRQGGEGDAGDRFPGQVFRNVLAGGGFSGVGFRIRLSGIAVKEGFQLARRQLQQALPERFFAEQVGPFRLACRVFGGLRRNRGRFRDDGGGRGCFHAGSQQEKQEYAQQDTEEQGSEETGFTAPDDDISRRCPGNACGGSGCRSGSGRCSCSGGSASRTARTGNGTVCRRPGNRCGGNSRCSRCRSGHTGGRFPVFRIAPEYRGRGFVRALREQAPVDEHGMAVDDKDIVRRRDEQRLAEQDAAGRVVEMGGDGFPRPAQGNPRLFGLSRVEAGEGCADAFQRRIPRNGGVARRCGLSGNGLGPQGTEPPKADFFQIGLQRFVLRRERALFRMQGGEGRRVRSLYEMKRITHSCTFSEMARRRWGREENFFVIESLSLTFPKARDFGNDGYFKTQCSGNS